MYFNIEDSIDTIVMEYKYQYRFGGTKKQLDIVVEDVEYGKSSSKLKYNKKEYPVFESNVLKEDTLNYQTWEYNDKLMTQANWITYQGDTSKTIYHFAGKEKLLREENFKYFDGKFYKIREKKYFYDKENERIQSITEDLKTGEKTYYKYVTLNY